jgi:hypothetical protein
MDTLSQDRALRLYIGIAMHKNNEVQHIYDAAHPT